MLAELYPLPLPCTRRFQVEAGIIGSGFVSDGKAGVGVFGGLSLDGIGRLVRVHPDPPIRSEVEPAVVWFAQAGDSFGRVHGR